MTTRKNYLDDSELRQLGVDLSDAPLRIQFNATDALRGASRLVNREMRKDASGHQGNFFGKPGTNFVQPLARHVTDELTGPLEAEIGIAYKGAGRLAHIIVFGSVNNAPVYDHTAGLRRAEPRILEMFADAAEESVLGEQDTA